MRTFKPMRIAPVTLPTSIARSFDVSQCLLGHEFYLERISKRGLGTRASSLPRPGIFLCEDGEMLAYTLNKLGPDPRISMDCLSIDSRAVYGYIWILPSLVPSHSPFIPWRSYLLPLTVPTK